MVAELFLYKWPSYRGFTAAKIAHLIAEIVPIQKIDPYIFEVQSLDNIYIYGPFCPGREKDPIYGPKIATPYLS